MKDVHDQRESARGFAAGSEEGRRARRSVAYYLAVGFVILVIFSILTQTVLWPDMGQDLSPTETIELPSAR